MGPLLELARNLTLSTNSGGHATVGRKPELHVDAVSAIGSNVTAERDQTWEQAKWRQCGQCGQRQLKGNFC